MTTMLPMPPSSRERVDTIRRLVCERYGITKRDLLGTDRHWHFVWPRWVFVYLLDNARVAADEEARQISELGREERERMERRFREVGPGIVKAVARENVEKLLRRGGPAA